MRLRHVSIPNFRALRGVELNFEASYQPQVFPLGSENGGGKSTLLQLLFGLLHCPQHPARRPYLDNLLSSYHHPASEAVAVVARLDVELDEGEHELAFVSLSDAFVQAHTKLRPISVAALGELALRQARYSKLEEQRDAALALGERLELYSDDDFRHDRNLYRELRRLGIAKRIERHDSSRSLISKEVADLCENLEARLPERGAELDQLRAQVDAIRHVLAANQLDLLTHYRDATGEQRVLALTSRTTYPALGILEVCAEQVFLLGPSNQQYLFLPSTTRLAHSSGTKAASSYLEQLSEAEDKLPNLFAYDWLSVDAMIQLFRQARDRDFAAAVAEGAYGDRYTTILREVNELLVGKTVRPLPDLGGVRFSITTPEGGELEVGLEDLSRGELKRLMIYAWLKAKEGSGALILVDELEASFHPDWQATIISDILEWAPQNQYILATHSYELCQAVTPSHIRQLEPRLSGAPGPEPT